MDMSKKLKEEKKTEISNLYKQGLSIEKIAMKTNVPASSVYELTRLKERGFDSYSKYNQYRIKLNGYNSCGEYEEELARLKGFESKTKYFKYLAEKRAKRRKNVSFSIFLKKALKDLNKNQSWLAKQLGVSDQLMSIYVHGRSIPNQEKFEKLVSILVPNSELRPKGVDDLVNLELLNMNIF